MLRLPAITVSTAHLPSAYLWHTRSGLPDTGVLIGLNALTGGTPFRYDPWACYSAGVIGSPNMLVIGQLGTGKSALVKTYTSRQLDAGRTGYVLDPKGEYAALAARHGLPLLRLAPHGSDRLNPLDAAEGEPAELTAARRAALVGTLAVGGLGRGLTAEERGGLTAAIRALPVGPTLGDLVELLHEPSSGMAAAMRSRPTVLAAALRDVAFELGELLDGPLAGMVDAATSVELDPSGPGLVVDLSAVFDTPALTPVMACVTGWLTHTLAAPSPRRRLLLVDEAWALLHAPATTRWLQAVSKLARRHGAQLITVVHRLSDLKSQADEPTATARQARGLLADADTRVVHYQTPGEGAELAELLGLSTAAAGCVSELPPHRALWLVGRHPAVVDHLLTPGADEALVDTDQAMRP